MRRRDRLTDLQAGVIALALIATGTYLGFTKGHLPWLQHPYEIDATFRSAASEIRKGSPVRIAGVNVGKVTAVRRGPGATAIVEMAIDDRGRPIHADAQAKIRPRLFLEGNFFVDLKPGTPAAPELRAGASIPLAQTQIPVQFDDILDTLQTSTRSDLQATVKGLASALDGGGARALNRSFPAWAPTFTNTAIAAQAVRGRRPGDLSRFVGGMARVSTAVAERQTDLRGLLTNFASVTDTLAARSAALQRTIVGLAHTASTARPALAAISGALPPLRRYARLLDPVLAAAPAAIRELRPVLREGGRLVMPGELPSLAAKLRPALRRTAAIETPLGALLERLQPTARCIGHNVVPVLDAKLNDGALSTGQPVWRELLHAAPGLASAGGNFDGAGHWIRYYAGVGDDSVATALPAADDILASLSPEPVVGARPRWTPGQPPALADRFACDDQALPNLAAAATPAPRVRVRHIDARQARQQIQTAARRQARQTPAQLRAALRRALERRPPR
jgi:virulence factor Mce-like protein